MNKKSVKSAPSGVFSEIRPLLQELTDMAWAKSRLLVLNARLGKGVGAKKERARLAKYINLAGDN